MDWRPAAGSIVPRAISILICAKLRYRNHLPYRSFQCSALPADAEKRYKFLEKKFIAFNPRIMMIPAAYSADILRVRQQSWRRTDEG
jgi:hypothetical protein